MKRLFGVLLALIVLLTCVGCGGGDKPADKPAAPAKTDEQNSDKVGVLVPIGLDETGYKRWTEDIAKVEGQPAGYVAPRSVVFFDNMNSMIMALKSKQIDRFTTCNRVAGYIVARNDEFKLVTIDNKPAMFKPILGFSMAMKESSAAQIEEINNAIKAMKEDGTLANLIKENITDLNGTDPVAKPIPVIEGAETLKVAVTGDMPALDCILADGTPAGFNVAFLGELGKRINKNFELVSVEAGARSSALASDKVDALFWVVGTYDENGNALPYPLDNMKDVAISVPYLTDSRAGVTLK